MKPSDDLLAILARLLLQPKQELLESIDFANLDLATFVKRYADPPEPVDIETRSSIREDVVVREIARLLAEDAGRDLRVIDACCGVANLAKRILKSIGSDSGRIHYSAVDRDTGCIHTVKSQEAAFRSFATFTLLQRQAWDLDGLVPQSIDLIVLNNSLHEIAPRVYPRMFNAFNALLRPNRGSICIVDMEALPEDAPEAIAIPWHGSEVDGILRAGGLAPELTLHDKQTRVYQAHCRYVDTGVDEARMKTEIQRVLRGKLEQAIHNREEIEAGIVSGRGDYRKWLVATGSLARIAEELAALGGV